MPRVPGCAAAEAGTMKAAAMMVAAMMTAANFVFMTVKVDAATPFGLHDIDPQQSDGVLMQENDPPALRW